MTVIDNHEALANEGEFRLSEAGARDYFELLKPRVMQYRHNAREGRLSD